MTEADPGAHLRFPDVPKLELDELIDQLVDRAQGVKRAQGRLRALLRAISSVTENLSTETVLRNIVESARELSGARFAALGIIGRNGGLDRLIQDGMDEEHIRRIGKLPEGKGLIGALIDDPSPIRLQQVDNDPRSAGFPTGHPPMSSFLGVPIRVRGDVYGNLYLAENTRGGFTSEDEELVIALALAAGTAISNARLYAESELQQKWLSASAEIGRLLLAEDTEDPLHTIAQRTYEIADSDLVTIGLITPDGSSLEIETALGDQAGTVRGRRLLLDETVAGRSVEEGRPLLLADEDEPVRRSALSGVIDLGPLMLVPLSGAGSMRGVLSVARRRGRPPFSSSDLAMVTGFADYASVALELADSRASEQKVALLEDRERIARDLHDHVIQELFAIGLSLQSVVTSLADEAAKDRIQQRIEDIDRTIRRIRTSIFVLRGPLDLAADGVRQQVMAIASDLKPALGFPPYVSFKGLVDLGTSSELGDDIVAAVRESLTNVAKHAQASEASVDVSIGDVEVVVTVTDNGIGAAGATRSSGTANLRARAESHGGSFEIEDRPEGGTVTTWRAPVS